MSNGWATLPQMVLAQARLYKERPVLQVKRRGRYEAISWNDLASQIEEVALGLMDLGLKPGDRVAIFSDNQPDWAAADLGTLAAGGVTVPVYTTLTTAEIEYILKDSEARILFVQNPEKAAKIFYIQEALDLKVVLFDAPFRVSGPRIWWMGELLGLGRTAAAQTKENLKTLLASGKREDLCSIIYTSGTTGPPKGVMLTHGNFLSNCEAVHEAVPLMQEDLLLSFLPLSHVFERMAGYYLPLLAGGKIAYAENMEKVPENIREVHPTVLTGVPRFYEKFKERIDEAIKSETGLKRLILLWAIQVGQEWAGKKVAGKKISWGLRLEYAVADTLVFSKLRERLGGRLRFCVSGGAPLSKELALFFYGVGVLILEGYGLTETSPVIAVNRPDRFRFGSVGPVIPGVEVRLAEDGEILTRGPHVMQGYFKQPEATAQAIDAEGWFHTGDVGQLDPEGFLTITDRKKDLIKTSGGKMVAPQNIEAALKKDPSIADALVIGDRRKYLTALIVPHLESVGAYAKKHSIHYANLDELVENPEIEALIWKRVERVNTTLASFEQIKKIALLAQPFSMVSGELTPTLKVKRQVVSQRYAQKIEALYHE